VAAVQRVVDDAVDGQIATLAVVLEMEGVAWVGLVV
jgi:hypothetical protein